jgi:hypothetical protein
VCQSTRLDAGTNTSARQKHNGTRPRVQLVHSSKKERFDAQHGCVTDHLTEIFGFFFGLQLRARRERRAASRL